MKTENNRFCAFLRGVNVKGTNMKMAEVCSVFEKVGMTEVSSLLASGNILFSYENTNPTGNGGTNGIQETDRRQALKSLLEKAMSKYFNYEAFLFIKDKNEIEALINDNPFAPDAGFHIYGFAGIEGIAEILMTEFDQSEKVSGEEARIVGGNFYWRIPKGGTLGSGFGKILGRKNLKDTFTSRNLNTFEKVFLKL